MHTDQSAWQALMCWTACCPAQADEGYLYPLERAFFYIHKPPMLLPHDEVAGIEFMRQGGGVLAASAKTFDLSIRLASNDQVPLVSCHKMQPIHLRDSCQCPALEPCQCAAERCARHCLGMACTAKQQMLGL